MLQIVLAVPVGAALAFMQRTFAKPRNGLLFLGPLVFLLAFLMALNTQASGAHNPLYPRVMLDMPACTSSEIQAAYTMATIASDTVKTDTRYYHPFYYQWGEPTQCLLLQEVEAKFSEAAGFIAIRDYAIDNSLSVKEGGSRYKYVFTYNPREELDKQGFNHVYDVVSVTGHYKQRHHGSHYGDLGSSP